MTSAVRIALCCAVIATTARSASAEWYFTPFVGFTFFGDTTIVDLEAAAGQVHFSFGGAATLIGDGPLGAEALFVYTPGFFERGDLTDVIRSRSLALMGNVVVAMPRRWNQYGLRPFFSGGLGMLHAATTDFADVFPGAKLLGYNLGGGAVGFLSDRTGARFDMRYFRNLRPGEPSGISVGPVRLHYWTATVGVVVRY